MGSEPSKSNYNSLKSDSESPSNSADKNGNLEEMKCEPQNSGTIIRNVWIGKKSINISDNHVCLITNPRIFDKYYYGLSLDVKIEEPKVNIFNIKNEYKILFKHWAIILELSNKTIVNIQFGRNGFSLKEFNETELKGENILKAISEIWGMKAHPVSFCYLGDANFEYNILKNILKRKKEEEKKHFTNKGVIYYNFVFKNCQHLTCDIEKILFKEINFWHSFNYYLEDFFKRFFSDIDLNSLKLKYNEQIKKENKEIYENNLKEIQKNENRRRVYFQGYHDYIMNRMNQMFYNKK